MKSHSLASLLHAFFHEWMGKQRNLSRHTVCSYRDTWKLFLRFASERKRREVAELSLTDLDAGEVLAFLEHLEKDRKVSLGTRNCRLAAIHSFFTFVSTHEPLAIAQCSEIARIPVKKMPRPVMCYLDAEEIAAVLRQPNRLSLGRTKGSRAARLPLQHGSANPGATGCVSAGHPVRITRSGRIARQRAQEPNLPAMARNDRSAQGVAEAPTARG